MLELKKDQRASAERFVKLAPFRLAGSLNFSGQSAGAADLSIDGTVDRGRMTAVVRLAGGEGNWHDEPIAELRRIWGLYAPQQAADD